MTICYCGNHLSFEECCQPYIKGTKKPATAETLMRSRYSAYATKNADYLVATTHISTRKNYKKKDILHWAETNKWTNLEILETTLNTVTFKASYLDNHKLPKIHHEKSTFILEDGNWFYVDGEF
ncbi:YchJ family protein [Flavobacterium sp.]|uniref:YchJ family protein n=1 Tax=Flavobacterium sp. TaxID=239 RepID=UPI00375061A7